MISILTGCTGRKIPDVSDVKVDLQMQRFEQDFFAIDPNHTDKSLEQLNNKYPGFLRDFIFNILALPPQPDSTKAVEQQVVAFVNSYKPLKDSADKIFANSADIQKQVRTGLQFVKHYFPSYKLPNKLITFIGPINSYGNILTTDALAVGLQLYMGSNYSLYQSEAGQELYPAYISRRFQKEYIPVNCIKTIVNDLFPDNDAGRPLIEQMVQAGKRLYMLDQFVPEAEDTLKTGYTKTQLDGCYKNEETIWSYFVQNDLLYVSDPSVIKDYMNDAPTTQAFGAESPGFIGQFVGWQIVKKWMGKNDKVTLQQLIETNPKTIFEQAKYKP
ncbi:gliding motility lipoprotein GldB [Segetibacter aerophilus]|uniref:Gliding motility lipoprotein GldB n=1 Tax=Segetibacter aerophilus TaxID=670293 RepID=A0A512BFF0_9BACT|nr:hypothetical protein [Segetibacter aerophilus]GEO10683.1 hypothetical protein SAE01_31790 [Segetibacter aerophilus]